MDDKHEGGPNDSPSSLEAYELADFAPGDPEVGFIKHSQRTAHRSFTGRLLQDPRCFSNRRKYWNVSIPVLICLLTATNSTSTGIMQFWGPERFHTTRLGFQCAVTSYLVPFAMASLVTAPLSEVVGRKRLYQVTTIFSALLFIPQALVRSLPVLLVVRCIQGVSSSAGNALVGGTIADLFPSSTRGPAMNVFVLSNLVGQGLAGVLGFAGQRYGIPWCYGVQGLALGVIGIATLFLDETRRDVLLARRMKSRASGTLDGENELASISLARSIRIACIRPLQYLFTEPIVSALSLWIGFAWSCIYLGMSSTLLVFEQYHWPPGILGLSQLTNTIGGILNFASSFHQEHLYKRASRRSPTGQAPPEARMHWALAGAFAFPACMYIFAWTGRPGWPWPAPAACLVGAGWSIGAMYSGVYNYLADAYEDVSSSAQASHGFVRTILAATFPLLTHGLYEGLGYPIASTTVASIALVLASAPLFITVYGARLRERSKVTSALTNGQF